MRRAPSLTLTALFLLSVPAAYAQTTRDTGPDPAEWVPEDALFYLGIADTAQLRDDFQSTAAYKMMQDKELEDLPATAGIWSKMAEKVKERLARLLDVDEDSLKNPLAGPLAFYLTAPPGAGADSIEPVLVAGIGDQQLMRQYFDSAVARMKATASSYDTVAGGDQTIHVFKGAKPAAESNGESPQDELDFEEGDAGVAVDEKIVQGVDEAFDRLLSPDKLPEKLAVCLAGDRLIASTTPERVKAALARDSKTLARSEDHKLLLSSFKPVGQIRTIINLPRLFDIARRDAKGSEADTLRQTLDVVGAGCLRSVVGHCRLGGKSYDSKIELLFLMTGERTGLARVFSMENAPVDAPPWTSSDTVFFASLNVDPPKLVDEILRIMGQNDPKAAEEARASLEQVPMPPEGQPVNMRKDLIDHLAGPLVAAVDIARPCGPGSLRGMLALAQRNRDAITRVIAPLLGQSKPQDVRGTPIYTEPQTGGSLAIGSDRLLFGSQALVESALAASASGGLSEDASFRRAKRTVPKEAWCVMYIDQRKMMEGLIELASKREQLVGEPLVGMVLMMLQTGGVDLSDSKLNKKILEYSAPAIMTVATTTEGVQVTMVGLNAEE
jgi:hypothetical protein